MNEFTHPEPCQSCDMYYAYMDGLCWECWQEAQADKAEAAAQGFNTKVEEK